MSGNLFKNRNWLLPPNYLNNPKSPIKGEPEIWEQSIISQKAEKYGWRPNFSSSRIRKSKIGMANTKTNFNRKKTPQPEVQRPQARCPQTLNYQKLQDTQKSNQEIQIDKYPSQAKICKQWEAEMEKLNSKYNLDCFSDSELDLESEEGNQYKYEYGYETFI